MFSSLQFEWRGPWWANLELCWAQPRHIIDTPGYVRGSCNQAVGRLLEGAVLWLFMAIHHDDNLHELGYKSRSSIYLVLSHDLRPFKAFWAKTSVVRLAWRDHSQLLTTSRKCRVGLSANRVTQKLQLMISGAQTRPESGSPMGCIFKRFQEVFLMILSMYSQVSGCRLSILGLAKRGDRCDVCVQVRSCP